MLRAAIFGIFISACLAAPVVTNDATPLTEATTNQDQQLTISEQPGPSDPVPEMEKSLDDISALIEKKHTVNTLISQGSYDFPVDFVFTWFNSNDEGARAKYNSRVASMDSKVLAVDATNRIRFTDAGELKYSLRSVSEFAPWVRKIHIVLADEMALPPWLKTQGNSINIVRHSEILPSSALPTFNSHSIESALHHINGIADHFVYFNDDMYINEPISKSTFFSANGSPNVWSGYSGTFKPERSHDAAVLNSLRLLNEHHQMNKWPRNTDLHHQAKALSVNAMKKVENEYSGDIQHTRDMPLRTRGDVWAVLLASVSCVDDGTCHRNSPPRSSFQILDSHSSLPGVFAAIRRDHPVLFCINDSDSSVAAKLQHELDARFPRPSPFEL